MEFSRQEYWNGSPFPSPGDLTNSGIELRSPALQADSLQAETQGNTVQTSVNNNVPKSAYSLRQMDMLKKDINKGK